MWGDGTILYPDHSDHTNPYVCVLKFTELYNKRINFTGRQLSIYCLCAPNSSFIACSQIMDHGLLNIFPLPAGRVLSFVNRGH